MELSLKGMKKKSFLCDYQFIKQQEKIYETRVIKRSTEDGQNTRGKVLQLRFLHEKMFFSPYGILSYEWQKKFNYRFLKERGSTTCGFNFICRVDPFGIQLIRMR